MSKSAIKHETVYPYTESGVQRLLKDIHKLWNEEVYGGDLDVTCLRVDLERALQSQCMTPRQRQAIALYYFCQLTERECARLLRVHRETVGRRVERALDNIADHMAGYDIRQPQTIYDADRIKRKNAFWLPLWNNSVLMNVKHWWDFGFINDAVYGELNTILGMPKPNADKRSGDAIPRSYSDEQLKRKFKREKPFSNVRPAFENRGKLTDTYGGKVPLKY